MRSRGSSRRTAVLPRQLQAFPSDIYGKYKRATAYFLDWILCARNSGVGNTGDENFKHLLDVYAHVVEAIAREPTALPPSLLAVWQHALDACECAITLRGRVALCFEATAGDTHAHFLACLRAWHTTLQQVSFRVKAPSKKKTKTKPKAVPTAKSVDFSNYYEVLDLPGDYFLDNVRESPSRTSLPQRRIPVMTAEDRNKRFEATLAREMNTELACLFMELEELSESVYSAYFDVKLEKKTLMEATALAKIAIDGAAAIISRLQLRYPSIRDAPDLLSMIVSYMDTKKMAELESRVTDAWTSSAMEDCAKYQYVSGTLLFDFISITQAMGSFVSALEKFTTGKMVIHGEKLCEERTGHYATSCPGDIPSFTQHLLPLLHNFVVFDHPHINDEEPLQSWFIAPFKQYFTTHTVSIDLVFMTVCWIRSLAALQGNQDLGRTISLSIMHGQTIADRMEASIARDASITGSQLMKQLLDRIQHSSKHSAVLRVNPLFAGCVLLDLHLNYLHYSVMWTLASPHFRAFCHLYAALCDRQVLMPFPLFEHAIKVFEPSIFKGTHRASARGSFARSYEASFGLAEAGLAAISNPRQNRSGRSQLCIPIQLQDFACAIRLLWQGDFSVLPWEAVAGGSWKTVLTAVSALFNNELFVTRVLSMDTLSISNDLNDLYQSLLSNDLRISTKSKTPCRSGDIVEVTARLLNYLDTMNKDGTATITSDAPSLLKVAHAVFMSSDDPDDFVETMVAEKCRQAASTVQKWLGESMTVESRYFLFPPTPTWRTIEFGPSRTAAGASESSVEVFASLFGMMTSSAGPLSDEHTKHLKDMIRNDPSLLGMVADCSTFELCTLLHQAAAGRARSLHLVEWMIQIGALENQPSHCRHPPVSGSDPSKLCNDLAVHSAARAGLVDIVRVLLEGGHFRDVNTVTFHTQESLAHIAVRNDDHITMDMLREFGSVITENDALGKFVYELPSRVAWKRELLQIAVAQRQANKLGIKTPLATERIHQYKVERANRTGELHGELIRQGSIGLCDGRGQSVRKKASEPSNPTLTQTRDPTAPVKPRQKKKTKKKKKKVVEASLTVNGSNNTESQPAEDTRLVQLEQALKTISRDSEPAASIDIKTSTQSMLDVIETVTTDIRYFADAKDITRFSKTVVLREASTASQVLFSMNKFFRRSTKLFGMLDARDALLNQLITLGVLTSRVFVALKRTPQAKELLELVERLLYKVSTHTLDFRSMVVALVDARKLTGLAPLAWSTVEAQQQFAWYSSDHGIDDATVLAQLDRMVEFKLFCLFSTPLLTLTKFEDLSDSISKAVREHVHAAFAHHYILIGAHSLEPLIAYDTQLKAAGIVHELVQDGRGKVVAFDFDFSVNAIRPIGPPNLA